jgi:adenosylcobinamide-GDP ribazoletransferase
MIREAEVFFAALRYFTRLPVPSFGQSEQQQEQQLERAVRYLPLVGVIVGIVGALLTVATAQVLPMPLAILAGMASTLLVTGAIHEDGFADAVDGFGGGRDKDQILEIMKDSRIGSFGAIGITLMLVGKFSALQQIGAWNGLRMLGFALIAGHALSRVAPTALMFALHYVREEGNAKSRPLVGALSVAGLGLAAVCGLAPCLLLWSSKAWLAIAMATAVTVIAAAYFVRRIGGYTGDCLGATQQLAELAFYFGLACKPS